MKKHLIILTILFSFGNLLAQTNNWQVQVGPEVNFTEARTLTTDTTVTEDVNITSSCFSAGLMKNLGYDISIGGIYAFGRTSYKKETASVHKYGVVGSVISGSVIFSLVYEYIYTKLPNVKINGSGMGVKINFAPFESYKVNFWLSANRKNQALGISLIY